MEQSSCDVDVGTLLTGLYTLDKFSWAVSFGTHHDLERKLRNVRTKLLSETRLELNGKSQSLARALLEATYDFRMVLLIYTDAEVSILSFQVPPKKKPSHF